ncbi:putative RDD family membrane protein YckC [Actimicrobium sp. GrIS 1.19]|uniref:RDD family protein n=1 Tax=Actimicrobium sp. GrIS 1.19 TaxID=3071708 RepID=UPI002E06C7D6|nr:putative RDD family membrane protein YckC [Actimicrobium sp. GrIS 1.19]
MNDVNATTELEYTGFWLRVWASIIDTILISFVIFPLLFAVFGKERLASGVMLSGASNLLFSYLLPALIVLVFWSTKQATPGKMVIGARIVDAKTGGAPSFAQQLIRYVGYFISAIPFCLGFIWVGFDKRKQGWHDKLAGTVVVRTKNGGNAPVRFE